jgi:FxsC-like protein
LHFFFSYSRDDARDPYLYRFYEDLCAELSTRGGIDPASTGFLDCEQPAGQMWPRTTGDALGTCLVFVPIYSPHYFGSHTCGQEWSAFSARSKERSESGGQPQGILPVWWVPLLADPPEVARYLQDTRDQFGPEYREFGLRYLLQLNENDSRYRQFLVRFATSILAAAADPPAPRVVSDLLSEPNAFAQGPRGGAVRELRPSARGSGPRKVTYVVAAAGREEMRAVRAALDVYGDGWEDWRPYHPACPDPVLLRAQGVAVTQRLVSDPMPADDSLFDVLDRAQETRELIVIIVDPWATGLPAYRQLLGRLDGVRSGNAAVVVPWEAVELLQTPEGRHARDRLFVSLGNWMDGGEPTFRDDIRSIEEFEEVLGQVLVAIRAQVINRAEVARRVTEDGPPTRPILTGTGI